MRLVFVNHVHPTTPHVSGMRAWYFARELSQRGHQVVLLCQSRKGIPQTTAPAGLPNLLARQDWTNPLVLGVDPVLQPSLDWIRAPSTLALFRKALVVWNYIFHSGVFGDFAGGAAPYLPALARHFKPDAVWGIFGNTDCWRIAQRLSWDSGCPWLGDMKDSWDIFIPPGLRRFLSARFSDMAAGTANSCFNSASLSRWFPVRKSLVYSGVADCFFTQAGVPPPPDNFRLILSGAVRNLKDLEDFLIGFRDFSIGTCGRGISGLELVYAGGEADRIRPVLEQVPPLVKVMILPYLKLPEFARLCQSATVNAYIRSSTTFHHKLLELLACGCPVVAYPGESQESQDLAAAVGGRLLVCQNPEQLSRTFRQLALAPFRRATTYIEESFSWARQAEALEGQFLDTIALFKTPSRLKNEAPTEAAKLVSSSSGKAAHSSTCQKAGNSTPRC